MKLVWTDPAIEDLLHALDFIGNNNPEAVLPMQMKFHAAADSLLDFPYKGRMGRVEGTRELLIMPSHFLVYKVDASCIRILRLFHMAQNYPSCFFD